VRYSPSLGALAALTGLIAIGALALAAPAAAETETLERAFVDAIATNPSLAARKARVDAQRQGIPVALAEALPQVSGQASAERFDRDDPTNRLTRTEVRETWRAGGTAQQLLYNSGRVRAAVSQARAQYKSSVSAYEESRSDLLLQTTRAYAEVRQTRAALAAQIATLENLETQKRYVEANQKKGFLTVTDVAQADARIAASRAQVARARADQVAAERAFIRIVGRPPGDLSVAAAPDGLPASLEEANALAARNRDALEAARQQVKAADAAVDLARSGGGLRLALEASSFYDDGFNLPQSGRIIDDTVALRMSVPLFTGGSVRARTQQQRDLRAAARLDLAVALRDVEEGVATGWATLDAARAAREAAEAEVAAAELAVRGAKREQQNGLRSVFEVLDQEQNLLNARLAAARAERDVSVAERRVLFEIGALSCVGCEMGKAR